MEGSCLVKFNGGCTVFGRCLILVHNKRFVATQLLGPQTSSFQRQHSCHQLHGIPRYKGISLHHAVSTIIIFRIEKRRVGLKSISCSKL